VDGAARGFGSGSRGRRYRGRPDDGAGFRDLSYRLGIELPITEGVCRVLDGTDLHE